MLNENSCTFLFAQSSLFLVTFERYPNTRVDSQRIGEIFIEYEQFLIKVLFEFLIIRFTCQFLFHHFVAQVQRSLIEHIANIDGRTQLDQFLNSNI